MYTQLAVTYNENERKKRFCIFNPRSKETLIEQTDGRENKLEKEDTGLVVTRWKQRFYIINYYFAFKVNI